MKSCEYRPRSPAIATDREREERERRERGEREERERRERREERERENDRKVNVSMIVVVVSW